MAEHYRFFNSTGDDIREYRADEFAEYFSRFLSDGLFAQDGKAGLKVTAGSGLSVNLEAGYAFIKGYMYKNDSVLPLALASADAYLPRVDRAVIRFDEVARTIRAVIKTGTPASTPQPPALTVTDTVKEISLAQIQVNKAAPAVSSVTDERMTTACGLVSSLITIPAAEMWDVWNQALTAIEAAWSARQEDIQGQWDTEFGLIKSAWQAWFSGVQNTLGLRVMAGTSEPAGIAAGDIWLKEV